jgi:hypothetical protein
MNNMRMHSEEGIKRQPSNGKERKRRRSPKMASHQMNHLSPPKIKIRGNEMVAPLPNELDNEKRSVLWWYSAVPAEVPLQAEQAMIDVLLRWKEKERGMMKDQPPFRLEEIRKNCHKTRMDLSQALSLRRHHMKLLNPFRTMPQLRLGKENDIRESARSFEEAVEGFLKRQQVDFMTETEQKEHFRKQAQKGELLRSTPDFVLRMPVVMKKCHGTQQHKQVLEERIIHWIEAKMFYGASSIPHNSKGAVGALLRTAKKYVNDFGPGAMIFMQGCGDRLAADLRREGVIVLSAYGMVDLHKVEAHQRSWCANKRGDILP